MKIAYILLWFPKPSETFIFREVQGLRELGLPLSVYTLYGPLRNNLSLEMSNHQIPVVNLGLKSIGRLLSDFAYWQKRRPQLAKGLFGKIVFRRWRSLLTLGENFWAFLSGFSLARMFEADGIEHIHAPWGTGCATAAWVASILTGIPFSFTGRSADIYPQDGSLSDKIEASLFVRTDVAAYVPYLQKHSPISQNKIHHVYSPVPILKANKCNSTFSTPVKLLAAGRFVEKKGFEYLLRAMARLIKKGRKVELTLAGSGHLGPYLHLLTWFLNISKAVHFKGFVSHDRMASLMARSDVFIMPSIEARCGDKDGVPNVVTEALFHRLPVIGTNVGGIPEAIISGQTGYLVEQRDECALARAIEHVIDNEAEAHRIAAQGFLLVREKFAVNSCHRQLHELLLREIKNAS